MDRLIENKMEKPSLKEVKEYFKNAKIVICVCDGKKYNVTLNNIRELVYNYAIMDDCANVDLVLWSPDKGYAEIVEYKDSVLDELPYIIAPKIDPIVTSVMTQFLTRSQIGINKYGTTLEENNTDDFLQHLKEELMDAVLYIEKLQSNGEK